MARLRVFQIEIEDGSDQTIQAALQAVRGGAMTPQVISEPAPPPAPAALPFHAPVSAVRELEPAAEPKKKKKGGRQAAATAAAPSGPSDDSLAGRVFTALAKRPMSSLELTGFLHLEPSQVYGACNALKNRGLIESKNDEAGDGTRRYFPAKQK